MNRHRFYKMEGSGNDFVFLDAREHDLADWPAERIRRVTDRRQGVGADGVVHLSGTAPGSVRMIYFNADGSRVDMCGNAALCSTRLAAHLGLIDRDAEMTVVADAGPYRSRPVGAEWDAELAFPPFEISRSLELETAPGELVAFYGVVGVAHVTILVDDIRAADVIGRGRQLRYADIFAPAGTNVNFIGRINDPDADAAWALRTYERGVEDETLACGTGTVASALALANVGLLELPVRVRSSSGAVYAISGRLAHGRAEDVWLSGPGRLVFTGELTD